MSDKVMTRQPRHRAFTLVKLPVVRPFDTLRPRKRETKGFTLIELLVVIAIIALLIALFAPNLTAALRHARTVQCANNLKRIGEAVMNRRAALGSDWDNRLLAGTWPEALLGYVSGETDIYVCPEDRDLTSGGMTENFPVQMAISPDHTWPGITHYCDLVPGPMCRKLSVQQHADWWDRVAAGGLPPPATYDGPEGYPNTYFLVFEDILGGGDWSIDDCQVKVELDENAIPTFYPADLPWSAHKMFFVWAADHTNALDSDEPLAVYPNETRSVTTFGALVSYGMNDDVAKLAGSTRKILAVDYELTVANSIQDHWSDWHENGVPTFARHAGKMNVLHMDGSVKLRSPQEIDPVETSVAKRYWQP